MIQIKCNDIYISKFSYERSILSIYVKLSKVLHLNVKLLKDFLLLLSKYIVY